MSAAAASTQQNLFPLPPTPTPTIPLIPRPTPTHTFTSPVLAPTAPTAPTHAKPSTSARASKVTKATKALLTFPAFTDGGPFSIVAGEEVVVEEVEEAVVVVEEEGGEGVDKCKAKAKDKAAWVRKQEKLREEWVMDVFRRTGRVPMCPWPGARGEDGKAGVGEKEGRGEPLVLAVLEEERGEKEKEKA